MAALKRLVERAIGGRGPDLRVARGYEGFGAAFGDDLSRDQRRLGLARAANMIAVQPSVFGVAPLALHAGSGALARRRPSQVVGFIADAQAGGDAGRAGAGSAAGRRATAICSAGTDAVMYGEAASGRAAFAR